MDRGELFEQPFTVTALASGFTVTIFTDEQYAFTTIDDLFDWLAEQKPKATLGHYPPTIASAAT